MKKEKLLKSGRIEVQSPVKVLRAGFVPDLQRIAWTGDDLKQMMSAQKITINISIFPFVKTYNALRY